MRNGRSLLLALVALGFLAPVLISRPSHASDDQTLSLRPISVHPIATIGLRQGGGGHPHSTAALPPPCDKEVDLDSSIAGVASIAAQDNGICTSADIDLYDKRRRTARRSGRRRGGGVHHHPHSRGRHSHRGDPEVLGPDQHLHAGREGVPAGGRRYIALALERTALGNAACVVVIVDVTSAPKSAKVSLVSRPLRSASIGTE